MGRKFVKISWLEALVLLLTALFVAGTLLWFHMGAPAEEVTFTGTGQAPAQEETAETPEAPGLLAGEILDLNMATLSDLTRLPGIGEKKGQAILDWRQANGGFESVEELLEVKGIGEGILAQIRPYVTVGTPTAEEGEDNGTDSGGG